MSRKEQTFNNAGINEIYARCITKQRENVGKKQKKNLTKTHIIGKCQAENNVNANKNSIQCRFLFPIALLGAELGKRNSNLYN